MNRYLLLFSFLFLSTVLLAQDDYVVTITGDTLRGEVVFLYPTDYDEPVRVKTDDDNRQFSSNQIRMYFVEGETYKTILHAGRYRIMKEMIDGYLGLYEFRSNKSYQFGTQLLHKISNKNLEVSALFFRKSAAKFLSECDAIVKALDQKEYGIGTVEELVIAYNKQCVDKVIIGSN